MSHDQCHSTTHGEHAQPGKEALLATPRALQRVNGTGERVWRGADELLDTPAFREHVEREFTSSIGDVVSRKVLNLRDAITVGNEEADNATGGSRRDFLKVMGASVALAGASAVLPACRRPEQHIYAYGKTVPEEIIPGKPLFYTSSMARPDGGSEGLLVETHEGRPTNVSGNPLHPVNLGKSTQWSIASIMGLYDPDRLKSPVYDNPARGRVEASWDDFRAWAGEHFKALEGQASSGLYVLVDGAESGPTFDSVLASFVQRYPKASVLRHNPLLSPGSVEGARMAFGSPMREMLNMTREGTRVIVSFDRDFLQRDAGELVAARQFASTRMLAKANDEMSRLYVVESGLSTTGASADHRVRLAPSRVSAFVIELAKFVLPKLGDSAADGLVAALGRVEGVAGEDIERVYVEEIGRDLLDAGNRGKSLLTAGPSQPAAIHALVAMMNQALGNIGASVSYVPMSEQEASDPGAVLSRLAGDIAAGKVKTLLTLGSNPAYAAMGGMAAGQSESLAGLLKKVPATITLSVGKSETESQSTWSLNGAHPLESWGDTRALDGTIAPIQPMIAPLYEPALSATELLAMLGSADKTAKIDGYELVRASWKTTLGKSLLSGGFEGTWRRALHDGIVAGSASAKPLAPKVKGDGLVQALGALRLPANPTKDSLELAFRVGKAADGRYANIAWLHELPDTGTMVVWDNPVLLSPRTAVTLGVAPVGFRMDADGKVALDSTSTTNDLNAMYTDPTYPTARMADVTVNGRTVRCPIWICPGVADNTAICTIGYGRTIAGLVGDGVGVNVLPLMSAGGAWSASGATIKATGERFMIASTQHHWTLDGKDPVLRFVDHAAWAKHGDEIEKLADSFYPENTHDLNFAERLGELSHTPPNLSIRVNPYGGGRGEAPDATKLKHKPGRGDPAGPRYQRPQPPEFASRPQWGMTIDQTLCTGCGTCMVACQSENNIAVVGKIETAKGREMHWIRVDRYFTGDDFNNPSGVHHQPVACVHCENAPCEVVCPVNATVHGPEGLNYMTYNRCIGTRYCANNCPYKVRRYNWFDYGVTKFNGTYYGKELVEAIAPDRGGITGSGQHNKINPNLIPPRLRQKLEEISRMQKNPDVTVRSRGVMEKCTYCIQRINAAKIDCKLADIKDSAGNFVVPDGFFQTACQQACPSEAIVFGDQLDTSSKLHASIKNPRAFALLGYLNTRPRTRHLLRVRNPNPAILKSVDTERYHHMADPFHHGGGHDTHDHGGGGGHGDGHGPTTYRDERKRTGDSGYALSLRVLGAGGLA